MFLSFLGCDGSGKSAVIAGVTERLEKQGVVVTRGHWRPVAFGGENSEGARVTADDPHGQKPRGMVSSVLKLGWLWLNWWVGWFRFLGKKSGEGVVVFDRYHADLLVDPRRYRYGGPLWLARLASRLMPQPDVVVFLDAEPEVLLARKQEVSREALATAREKYLVLAATHPRFRVVDASQALEAVIDDVMNEVGRSRPGPPP
jgi:thymidylate kinase